MFFGLTNSPATFQTMMNDIFKELIDEGVVTIYMDNILIYAFVCEWGNNNNIVVASALSCTWVGPCSSQQ